MYEGEKIRETVAYFCMTLLKNPLEEETLREDEKCQQFPKWKNPFHLTSFLPLPPHSLFEQIFS
jgi:hypothetical protein